MWMDPAWDGSQGPRPGTASIRVRELSWQGLTNPCPQNKRRGSHGDIHRERRVEEHLSPARLVSLTFPPVGSLPAAQVTQASPGIEITHGTVGPGFRNYWLRPVLKQTRSLLFKS
ncbi:Leucine-rich repeat-containing protein 56 [Microtus ochrogaster]|uniref:Leucine-rich repeat-containing protein 56 n=1 Tax=Microtus ochrogaster TaxID=79684 RepID=A0A8J6G103_MICOH|nr:Leucine-rich repeat-containing protein 56 [Microtus ochrogaster]